MVEVDVSRMYMEPTPEPFPLDQLRHMARSAAASVVTGALFLSLGLGFGRSIPDESSHRQTAAVATALPAKTKKEPCAIVPQSNIRFAQEAYARAPSEISRYAQYDQSFETFEQKQDRIISAIAHDNALTVVPYAPFTKKLWQGEPNIERDFALTKADAKRYYDVDISPLAQRVDGVDGDGNVISINPFDRMKNTDNTAFKVRVALDGIIHRLHRYPVEFVRMIGLKSIKLGTGDGATGLAETDKGIVNVDVVSAAIVLDHEVSHVANHAACDGHSDDDPGFSALNPAGFSYVEMKSTVTSPSVEKALEDSAPALEEKSFTYSEYGKTNVAEDEADEGARLIGGRSYEILRSRSAIVKEKLFYLAGRMAGTDLGKRLVRYFALLNAVHDE